LKSKSILLSVLISCLIGYLFYFFFYIIAGKPGNYFNITIIWIIATYALLCIGILVLVLRLFRILKSNSDFLYTFFGVINHCIGIFCLILYLFKKVDLLWLHECLFNLFVGSLIISDIYVFK
jgi:hypothetical protein